MLSFSCLLIGFQTTLKANLPLSMTAIPLCSKLTVELVRSAMKGECNGVNQLS